MFGGDFGLPPGPRYGRRSTGGAPPVAYLCHAVAPRRSSCRIVELVVFNEHKSDRHDDQVVIRLEETQKI